jgi:glycerol-3-phosphate acyltransferase PlsY
MLSLLIILLLSYLAGSIPTAILASRLVLKDDIRKHGSGNAGTTNVFRVMGWKPALVVLLIDIGKGMVSVLLISKIQIDAIPLDSIIVQILAGVFAIVGHIWTVFAGFRGGKGVGTAFGVLVSLVPMASLISLAIWIILVLITRIVSIGSLAAGVLFPVILVLQKKWLNPELPLAFIILGIGLGLLVIITHRENIKRLLKGEENRFGRKRVKS